MATFEREREDSIARHVREINRCNQRGGRMLSIVDLLAAGTVDLDLAAYLFAAVSGGQSFLVGCLPGGAGKTTVMCALLNLVPADALLAPADGHEAIAAAMANPAPRRCMICHEIGSGPYYAYLWGEEARSFFGLPAAGHMIATNLHTDDLDACRAQLCGENGVSDGDFESVGLKLFLRVGSVREGRRRRVVAAHESSRGQGHRLVFRWDERGDRLERLEPSRLTSSEREAECRGVIEGLANRKILTAEAVRAAIFDGLK